MSLEVCKQHSRETKIHAVYAAVFLSIPREEIAAIFRVHVSTIKRWIDRFHETGDVERVSSQSPLPKKFQQQHLTWIVNYVMQNPLHTLYRIRVSFLRTFRGLTVSTSTIWRIISRAGFSYRCIERRALQARRQQISAYTKEFNYLTPMLEQLVFLDEVSVDNRSMMKKKGYFHSSMAPILTENFKRSSRISVLAFCTVDGVLDIFQEDGTFSRRSFFSCLEKLVDRGALGVWPAPRSILVMDGASIHMDPNIVLWARACGLHVLYLPAYCPYYNPIEYLFGYIKTYCKTTYCDQWVGKEHLLLYQAFATFARHDMRPTFRKCGYRPGHFDPGANYHPDYKFHLDFAHEQ